MPGDDEHEGRDDDEPYVCPGCYAINGEACAAYCVDASIARRQEEDELDDLFDFASYYARDDEENG